jgi:very-short-patch-repair endonuclease
MSGLDSKQLELGRDRIIQVFEYLKALNEHRSPAKRQINEQPWILWHDSLPDHPAIALGVGQRDNESQDNDSPQPDEDFVLRVRRPKLTPAPTPPEELRPWIKSGWEDPENAEITWIESKNEVDDEGETFIITFGDDSARPDLLDIWRPTREQWRQNELPARRAMKVFERLYELHGRIEREAERLDLVLGDGLLSWKCDEGGIFHPVLIQRVQLTFDATVPEFTIADSDYGVELYTALFQSNTDVAPQSLATCRDELDQGDYHPLAEDASAFLKRFAVALSSHGEFIGEGRPPVESEYPTIGRSPVLFLRSRTLGFSNAIDCVLGKLRKRAGFSTGLTNVVGVEAAPTWEDEPSETRSTSQAALSDAEILFGKEANPEQIRIAQRLAKYGSVLVQGPPGTGKSHTIANLIGHLLAQHKSVLVTSHTTKALRVLRQHVVDELRPLCVSVLDSDLDSRRQLEDSVMAISSRLSESDADALEEEAEQLKKARLQLISRLESLQADLLTARTAEYRDVVIAGRSITPSQAARKIAAGRGEHDWIPGPVALGDPLPISPSEVVELYATNANTCAEDDAHVDNLLPEADELPSPEEFQETVRTSDELSEQSESHDDEYWPSAKFTTQHLQQLEGLIQSLRRSVGEVRAMEPWRLAAVDAGRSGDADLAPWEHLLGKIEETRRFVSDAKLDAVTHAPEVSNSIPLEEQRQLVVAIRSHLESGKRLGWFTLVRKKSWREAIRSWRVRGNAPQHAEHFAAVERTIVVTIARDELGLLWDVLMSRHGVPGAQEMGEQPEQVCAQYADMIADATTWWRNNWDPLVHDLKQLGFDWERFASQQPPSFGDYGLMMRIVDGVEQRLLANLTATTNRLRSLYLKMKLRKSSERVSQFTRPEVQDLRRAIEHNDAHGYQQAHTYLVSAISRRQYALRRRELLRRVERNSNTGAPIAEAWATHIRGRIKEHAGNEPPGDPTIAWEWRQLNDELDRRTDVDIDELTAEVDELTRRLAETTVKLIDRRAWAGQVRRTTLRQQQALIGWLDTIRRIGRGFGKRAPRQRMEARRKMSECVEAVPVWIMPLARLVENFDFEEAEFDVVIIDEASQCDVMMLLAFAIAKQVIVVGDHEQVSPSAVGQNVDIVDNLIRLHLQGIPNSDLYDGKMSVYDLARQSFGGTICLLEHFRSVPDIIQFSNHLSYEGKIRPLRDDSASPLRNSVVPYRVEATTRIGKVNPAEARAVASLVIAATEDTAYEGQSFGVVSLVGDEQALEIEKLLLTHLPPEQFESRRIVCGNSAQFQGDERDVMFLSLVDAPRGTPLPIRQQTAFQQRFNVAASRARNQMWVVYSVSPETDLKPGDLRRRLIEHALDPKALTRELERAEARAESEFERQVIRRLVEAQYDVVPQWKVGSYRIDIVVEGVERRLAVECDGDRYHPIEKLPDDMARQAILERLGWRFHRIRGSEYFRDPDRAMARLFDKLAKLGIKPSSGDTSTVDVESGASSELLDSVIRRAAEIRRSWECEEESEDVDDPGNDRAEGSIQQDDAQLPMFQKQSDADTTTVEQNDAAVSPQAPNSPSLFDNPPQDDHHENIAPVPERPTETDKLVDSSEAQQGKESFNNEQAVSTDVPESAKIVLSPLSTNLLAEGETIDEDVETAEPESISRESKTVEIAPSATETGVTISRAKVRDTLAQQTLIETNESDEPIKTGGEPSRAGVVEVQHPQEIVEKAPPLPASDNVRVAMRQSPYTEYDGPKCEDPRTGNKSAIAEGLARIVDVEGPMFARRAYDIYRRSCSIGRMDRDLKRKMNSAMQYAIDQGFVVKEDELHIGGLLHCIMRPRGTPMIQFRERGSRSIDEIPPSELLVAASITERTGRFPRASDEHLRAILEFYGLSRLTSNARETIEKCLTLRLQSVNEFVG